MGAKGMKNSGTISYKFSLVMWYFKSGFKHQQFRKLLRLFLPPPNKQVLDVEIVEDYQLEMHIK
jgi:hypothetical protein